MTRNRSRIIPSPALITLGRETVQCKSNADSNWVLTSDKVITVNPSVGLVRKVLKAEFTTDELHPGPPYNSGGPFDRKLVEDPGLEVVEFGHYVWPGYPPELESIYANIWPKYIYTYDGGFICSIGPDVNIDGITKDSSLWDTYAPDVAPYGASGWAKYQPIKPVVDLGQFVYELDELPRMLQTTAKGFRDVWRSLGGNRVTFTPKKVADQFLNHTFGWAPFVNDLSKLFDYQQRAARQYSWMSSANGKWRKRGGKVSSYDSGTSTTISSSVVLYAPGLSTAWDSYGWSRDWTRTSIRTQREIWFEGSFRFYIPNLEPYNKWSKDYISRLGLGMSPSLIYELTPWSWLIDWFTNLGDVIKNAEVYSQVAARYAYVMGSTQRVKTVETMKPFGGHDLTHTWNFPISRKQRVGASPFGFGLTWDGFSTSQLAILSALGITRL